MIATITGKITELDVDRVVIETGGIGYELFISFKTYLQLKAQPGETVQTLLVFHLITDRSQKLFGFTDKKSREVFIALKSLSGLGEATALKILSFLTPDEIYQAALNNDNAVLEKIPKIREKTSEKILFELNRNLKKFSMLIESPSEKEYSNNTLRDTSILALIQLGFDEKTAAKKVDAVLKISSNMDVGEIIKEALHN